MESKGLCVTFTYVHPLHVLDRRIIKDKNNLTNVSKSTNMQVILSIIIIIFSLFHPIIPNLALHISHHQGNETDRDALLAIKSKIPQDPLMLLSTWNESTPLCEWRGITCGRRHKRVIRLDLSSGRLVGTLSPFVGNLSFLRELKLSDNTFGGSINPQIGHLSRLNLLELQNNSFQGEIPANLSRCVHLTRLSLSRNRLTGRIPVELSSLPNLKLLELTYNNLSGRLQEIGITNMTSLEELSLVGNQLEGSLPYDIGHLKRLTTIAVGDNRLSGTIPPSLYNMSSLKAIHLDSSGIHGKLPQDLGLLLPNLQFFLIEDNYLSGWVPKSLSNLSQLVQIDISYNNFIGKFLFNGNNMQKLQWVALVSAFSQAEQDTNSLWFLETLTNCTSLSNLEAGLNGFGGVLPNSIANLSTNLRFLGLNSNGISGSIPVGMSKYVNLYHLYLHDNQFTGHIPVDVGGMENLVAAFLDFNLLSGNIPSSLGNLSHLTDLILNGNNLVGNIPSSLGNCKYLLRLYLFQNNISGVLPPELFYASELVQLGIHENNLGGAIPLEISNLKNLVSFYVSNNMFSGEIPITLGRCTSLLEIDMGGNSFSGSIPQSLSSLKSIQLLNLSHNRLSGQIPSYFSNLPLLTLDLSFNGLAGEVPVQGIFSNTTAVSLDGNKQLCGGVTELHFPRCPSQRRAKRRKVSVKIIITIAAAGVFIVVLALALLFYFLHHKRKMKSSPSETLDIRAFLEVSYRMLWEATQGFSASNLIGVGGFGSVYKGTIQQVDENLQVAIKVMNHYNERADKSLIAECKALRNIRHRNLVKIITACSSIDYQGNDFKALVYEFMPNGSLESWLYSVGLIDGNQLRCLSLLQRLSIAIHVACAIDYLHNECPTPIIHCDLKPSNILLDDEMIAHVSDFGLAKFLLGDSGTGNQTSSSQVRGTVGYTAPEYGVGGKVSKEGDTYSFGVIILEMITNKRPTDPMFNDGFNLCNFAKSKLGNNSVEIVDPKLIDDGNIRLARGNGNSRKIECIKLLINIGIQCTSEMPQERMHMKDVVNQLKTAKQNLLSRRV